MMEERGTISIPAVPADLEKIPINESVFISAMLNEDD
jgi:hypothetical protein